VASLLRPGASVRADYEPTPVDFTLQQLGGEEVSLGDYRENMVVSGRPGARPAARKCGTVRLHEQRADVTVLSLAYEEVEDNDFEAFLQSCRSTIDPRRRHTPEPFPAPPKVLPDHHPGSRGAR
jgi:hypothetical protein